MNTTTLHILLIEDNPVDVAFLRIALERDTFARYQVTVAERLKHGLQTLADEPFDAILLDLGLPDSQGLATFQTLYAIAGDTPTVVLSGLADDAMAMRAVQAGAQDYIVKGEAGWEVVARAVRYAIERHELLRSKKASEQRFAVAFHGSPVGQAITTLKEGRFIDVNAAYCRLLGYNREDMIGRTTLAINVWADLVERQATFEVFRLTGHVKNREVVFRTRSGELLNILASVEPIEINGEQCVISTALDITDRKQAEKDLRQSEERHRLISGIISDYVYSGVAYRDGKARTDWVSGAFEHITGYTMDEVNALPGGYSDLVLAEDLKKLTSETPDFLTVESRVIEYRIHRKDGEIRWLRDYMRLIPGSATEQAVRRIGAVQDITEHKNALEQLRASEQKLRSLLQSETHFVVRIDIAGHFTYWNETYKQAFGWAHPEPDFRNAHPADSICEYHHQRMYDTVEQCITHPGKVIRVELDKPARDGSIRTSLWEWVCLTDEHNQPSEIQCMGIEITDLKHAQQELQELNRSLEERVSQRTAEVQDLYDNAPTGYHSLDAAGRIIMINRTELNWLGYERDEVIGRHLGEFITPESQNIFGQIFPDFKQRGYAYGIEIEFIRKDRTTFPALVNATAIYDADGDYIQSRSTIFDITDRKRAEQALRESEEQNRLLFENTPDAIVLFDTQGRIMRANRAFARLSGFAAEACIGQSMVSLGLLPPEQETALASIVAANLPKESGFASAEFRIAGANGDPRDVGARIFGVTFQGRQHYLSSMRDITAEKQVEETLRLANLEMQRALRMKDEFLANMSHELRTPLQGILGMSESLLEEIRGPLNERQRKSVELIESSGRHLLDLINDLLDLSKIEAGKLDLHLEETPVDEICQASLEFVREIASRKKIRLEYLNALSSARLSADTIRLKQMLVNLLSNAVKFTPEGGQVSLSVSVDPAAQRIHFAVQDTGPGITAADQARLFQPFTQLDSKLSRQFEGTGLGLALVKRLAEQHGGTVRLESAGIPGQGSRFTISLPNAFVPPPPSPHAQTAVAAAGGAIAGPRLLLVEDNEVNIEVVTDYLNHAGYRVVAAHTGLQALELAEAIDPELILMDIQLPQIDGLEVTRRLRAQARFAATPIIAITASAMSGDRERCLAAGATDYMSKPLHMKELLEMVRKLIESRSEHE